MAKNYTHENFIMQATCLWSTLSLPTKQKLTFFPPFLVVLAFSSTFAQILSKQLYL